MAQDYVRLTPVKETKDLTKFMATVLPADLLATLRQVSAFEIGEQMSAGNKPSAIIVDGTQKSIASAMRRVVALFGDTSQLAAAIHDAFQILRTLTRVKTGRARGSYRLLLNSKAAGDEGATDQTAARMTNRDRALILGPLTAYGRKLYWNPAGGSKNIKARVKRKKVGDFRTLGGETVRVFSKSREPIHIAAVRILKRRYRALSIDEVWIKTPVMSGIGSDDRMPAIAIRYKAGRRARGS